MNDLIEKVLAKLERLCSWYLEWRTGQWVKKNPDLARFDLHRADFSQRDWSITALAPSVALLAEQGAALLDANEAKNYVEFELMPRLDRGLRPIRVTVRWSNGRLPSQEVARLKGRFAEIDQLLTDIGGKRPTEGDMLAIHAVVKLAVHGVLWTKEDDNG